jgi:AraC-like DNA-binding protein
VAATDAAAAAPPDFALAERSYGAEPRTERHPHVQVVLPLLGALEMAIAGDRGAVAGRRWALVGPGVEHAFAAAGPNRFLVVDFRGSLAVPSRSGVGNPFRDLDDRQSALLALLRLEAGSGALAEPSVGEALGRYARAALGLDGTTGTDAGVGGGATRHVAATVRAFLDDAWADPIGLADAAHAACCSPAHATRSFRAVYGLGPIAYLQRVRVSHARRLLETTDLSAGEVAARVGFVSQPWFTRLFAREVGVPPGAYRAAMWRDSGKPRSGSGKP